MMYSKDAFTIAAHIRQLRDRGLNIEDEALAAHYLTHVSYYRLA